MQTFINGEWVDKKPSHGEKFKVEIVTSSGIGFVESYWFGDENMKITRLSFKQRFTQDERLAIRAAAETNPVVYDFQDLVDSATYIDLARTDTIDAVKQLEQFGLIAEGRSDVILGPPIAESEKWQG